MDPTVLCATHAAKPSPMQLLPLISSNLRKVNRRTRPLRRPRRACRFLPFWDMVLRASQGSPPKLPVIVGLGPAGRRQTMCSKQGACGRFAELVARSRATRPSGEELSVERERGAKEVKKGLNTDAGPPHVPVVRPASRSSRRSGEVDPSFPWTPSVTLVPSSLPLSSLVRS